MKKVYVLFNSKAGKGTGERETKKLATIMNEYKLVYCDITQIGNYEEFVQTVMVH